jgi:uncharacterized membrane protein YkvA (DUF1232 family)
MRGDHLMSIDEARMAEPDPAAASKASGQAVILYDPAKLEHDQKLVERSFWKKLRRFASKLPFVDEVLAAYFCAMDPATPIQVKAVLFGALAYFIMPIDLIPDFIGWFGFSDDAAVLYAAIRTVSGSIKPSHRDQARASLDRLADK